MLELEEGCSGRGMGGRDALAISATGGATLNLAGLALRRWATAGDAGLQELTLDVGRCASHLRRWLHQELGVGVLLDGDEGRVRLQRGRALRAAETRGRELEVGVCGRFGCVEDPEERRSRQHRRRRLVPWQLRPWERRSSHLKTCRRSGNRRLREAPQRLLAWTRLL